MVSSEAHVFVLLYGMTHLPGHKPRFWVLYYYLTTTASATFPAAWLPSES